MNIFRLFAFISCTLLLAAAWQPAAAQPSSEETLTRSARFADSGSAANALYLRNINGSVEITGYDGDELRITARRTFRGSSSELRLAEEEMELVVEEEEARILVYVDAPFIELHRRSDGSLNYRVERNSDHDDYEFLYDITVEVPRVTMVDASTMNRGDLYTDFENLTRLQAETSESSRSSGPATRYRVDRNSPVRIGSGGPVFRFEVLNGDVYIRKI